jgi:hypothetical protein
LRNLSYILLISFLRAASRDGWAIFEHAQECKGLGQGFQNIPASSDFIMESNINREKKVVTKFFII